MSYTKLGAAALASLWLAACSDGDGASCEPLTTTTAPMTLAESTTRTSEAAVGNLITDALLAATSGMGAVAAVHNGGGIRYESELESDGVREEIAAGPLDTCVWREVMKFRNDLVLVTMTGAQLAEVLERSVSALGLPGAQQEEGWFLQVSGLRFAVDCAKQAQVIDADLGTVTQPGSRVSDVVVGGAALDPSASYTLAMNAFLAAGNDGYVGLKALAPAPTGLFDQDVVEAWLKAQASVTPKLDVPARIQKAASCTAP